MPRLTRYLLLPTVQTAVQPLASDHLSVYPNSTLKDSRYTILRKLGEGVSATTWLVRDSQGRPQDSYLATKILTAEATKMHEAGKTKELEILKELRDMGVDREYLPLMYDDFVERSPLGSHLCIVMSLYGDSVSALRRSSPTKALPPYMVRNIIHMLVEALDQLHERRIVHTDVKLSNLLFGNSLYYNDKDLERYLESHPVETVGDFELKGRRYPILEQPIPHPYAWDTSAFEVEKMIIYLVDFGHAQRAGEQPTADGFGALALRAPEVILWSDFGPGVDIWAVGCITFELLVGRWLFEPEEGEDWSIDDDHLAKMMELTGQSFPQSMLERSKRSKQYFADDGNLLRINELIPSSLETAMANYKIPGLSEDEIKKAAGFIRACLRFDYKERATAKELQDHPFLADAFKC
ncbi:kinase-like domain-containing protein [Mycena sp. CBHHK59/15]|nr:kinase-like domain-containing protein [Mycena sp. CBHHK59/15]